MKDDILDLISSYTRKISSCEDLINLSTDNLSKVRLGAKKSTYEQVIMDLKHILKDNEEDCT